MNYVRRSRYSFVRALDDGALVAVSVLAGCEYPLNDRLFALWRAVPADHWITLAEAVAGDGEDVAVTCQDDIRHLADLGLLVSTDPDASLVELRRRDEALAAPAWNRYAAAYASLTQWSGVHGVLKPTLERKRTGFWPPPAHFHSVPSLRVQQLPLVERDGGLYSALKARRTSRGYDWSRPLSLEDLSVILRYVWGCHGSKQIIPGELTILRKTSPSGGSQHPVEVYPILSNVDGVEPGIYHYNVECHSLELMEQLAAVEASELCFAMSADQSHCGQAPAIFVMAARWSRNHWKYVAHPKALRAILVDAGHLTQSFYLVCAELGLGAFVTGAINDKDIAERLGLPAFTEGVLLLSGCGHSVPSDDDPVFVPYQPPRATPPG